MHSFFSIYISNVIPLPGFLSISPHPISPLPSSMKIFPHPSTHLFPPPRTDIPLTRGWGWGGVGWGVQLWQDQELLLPLVPDKVILCYICSGSHGSVQYIAFLTTKNFIKSQQFFDKFSYFVNKEDCLYAKLAAETDTVPYIFNPSLRKQIS